MMLNENSGRPPPRIHPGPELRSAVCLFSLYLLCSRFFLSFSESGRRRRPSATHPNQSQGQTLANESEEEPD